MTKEILYTYVGDNGTVTTSIHLEGVAGTLVKYRLTAGKGKVLTNGTVRRKSVTVAAASVDSWTEIDE